MNESLRMIAIQTSPDGRVVALGSNGRAYWYQGQHIENNQVIAERWVLYPELPVDESNAAPLDDSQF